MIRNRGECAGRWC